MSRFELEYMIEIVRKKMIKIGLEEGLVSQNTIKYSQMLDQLLNMKRKLI